MKYRLVAGCKEGKGCSDGRMCGKSTDSCHCSFEECLEKARSAKSDGFSYRGTGNKWCRMCTRDEITKSWTPKDPFGKVVEWGVYTLDTPGK